MRARRHYRLGCYSLSSGSVQLNGGPRELAVTSNLVNAILSGTSLLTNRVPDGHGSVAKQIRKVFVT